MEDHGYVLDLGVKDLTGFLPKKEAKTYIEKYNRDEELAVGQYVECLVEKKNNRTVHVTIDRTKIASSAVEDPFSRITSILPGQRVTAFRDSRKQSYDTARSTDIACVPHLSARNKLPIRSVFDPRRLRCGEAGGKTHKAVRRFSDDEGWTYYGAQLR